jgi:hypothetical protein
MAAQNREAVPVAQRVAIRSRQSRKKAVAKNGISVLGGEAVDFPD